MSCFWSDSLSVILPHFIDKETEAWKTCVSFPTDVEIETSERKPSTWHQSKILSITPQ